MVSFQRLREYQELIKRFLDSQLSADEFEQRYFYMYKNEKETNESPVIAEILGKLFSDLDEYDEGYMEGDKYAISLNELKYRATSYLKRIDEILRNDRDA